MHPAFRCRASIATLSSSFGLIEAARMVALRFWIQTDPDYFVFPIALLRDVPRSVSWNKLMLKHVPDWESYRSRWDLIQSFLQRSTATA